ncbi:unnamed protein product [Trypanosoma congolense IL3000]|uniref:WGS project CAEQ00000000 data, annotated contig 166 n=1 Tax=Trypanosoma congolense (strain IL3000) TaxID=1068625 RepID=F9W7W1_TRYCI|nr:unnamed protein product [Trypanosoma congolense IL3000]
MPRKLLWQCFSKGPKLSEEGMLLFLFMSGMESCCYGVCKRGFNKRRHLVTFSVGYPFIIKLTTKQVEFRTIFENPPCYAAALKALAVSVTGNPTSFSRYACTLRKANDDRSASLGQPSVIWLFRQQPTRLHESTELILPPKSLPSYGACPLKPVKAHVCVESSILHILLAIGVHDINSHHSGWQTFHLLLYIGIEWMMDLCAAVMTWAWRLSLV